ncbi:MAG: family transcriptional regulator [Candidatus Sulfotelmatobacter sp.]|nr:family transcriptional regulator [Candidatus Sulfotelmatobacter sp.]
MSTSEAGSNTKLAERVKSILASRDLTLHKASQLSAELFGRSSPHYLPHNFYYDLRHGSFSPSLFQVFALSRISNYRVTDWLRVFGFDVAVIPRLQLQLPSRRTVLLDSALDDPNAFIPWLGNLGISPPLAGVLPLSQFLEWTKPGPLASLAELQHKGFLYAKIGYQDALAFPELLAGSIVRVTPGTTGDLVGQMTGEGSKNLFLVEHGKGLCCCQIRTVSGGRFALISTQLPFAQVALKVPEEARLVGVVDLEIRSLLRPQQPAIAKELAKRWKPEVFSAEPSQLGPLLRRARLRMGLSFRAASAISREVANLLDDDRYFVAPGSLSDYEMLNIPPRHFHKIVTFCAAYSLHLEKIFATLRLSLRDYADEPIPQLLTGRLSPAMAETAVETNEVELTGFVGKLFAELGEVPFFLRESLKGLSGLTRPSLKDFFWIGGTGSAFHPYLAGGLLAVVNRQKKKPNDCGSKPLWQQPLFVILKRDGNYVCGCCSRENNSLIVHSYPGGVHRREQFRNRDAEVIGKIVTIVRRLI